MIYGDIIAACRTGLIGACLCSNRLAENHMQNTLVEVMYAIRYPCFPYLPRIA